MGVKAMGMLRVCQVNSAQELPGPSVGVLPLHMIEEETAGEDGDHAEETPNSPPFGKFGTVLTVESSVEMGVVDLDSDSHSD